MKEDDISGAIQLPVDAYAAVGGLDKQIQQIRDLIEIPLLRPDLFNYFGTYILLVLLLGTPGKLTLRLL